MLVLCVVYRGQFGTLCFFFFQAEDGIRDLVRSRGLGDVYKRQSKCRGLHEKGFLGNVDTFPGSEPGSLATG